MDRADELLAEMRKEYDASLRQKHVSERAVLLTHEVLEKLRSVLDRLARRYWELHVKPHLSADEQARATIYFPIVPDEQGFASSMGRWRWKSVAAAHQPFTDYLRSHQPYILTGAQWLPTLNDIVQRGKHIDLVPQKRVEDKRTVVSSQHGSVSWGSGVRFGGGVRVQGAPINPATQRIVPTPGVTERIEVWVSFIIDGFGVNALSFTEQAAASVRKIAVEMSAKFAI
ncbi:hypothetical protein [Sphingobium sp. RSMS]|uniref:hypothetical protein n=1 Tax=Sphingobium sp. RSMS TaxID=520734 RepID=UPI0010F7A845|nr:hypothetical protein [Sphingobium sp. RSMS]